MSASWNYDATIDERCSCGATFKICAYSSTSTDAAERWRADHRHVVPSPPSHPVRPRLTVRPRQRWVGRQGWRE